MVYIATTIKKIKFEDIKVGDIIISFNPLIATIVINKKQDHFVFIYPKEGMVELNKGYKDKNTLYLKAIIKTKKRR